MASLKDLGKRLSDLFQQGGNAIQHTASNFGSAFNNNIQQPMQRFNQQAPQQIANFVNAPFIRIGQDASRINASIPQNQPAMQRINQAFPSIVGSVAKNLPGGPQYVSNNFLQPAATALNPKASFVNRVSGVVQAGLNTAAPEFTVPFAAANSLLNAYQGGKPVAKPYQAMYQGFVGNQTKSPGEALGKDKKGKLALDAAGFAAPLFMGHTGKPTFNEEQVNMVRNGFSPEVRNLVGKFAQIAEENPNVNRKNMGQLGEYIHSLATTVFGKEAENLNNKQLKNAFDVIIQQADKKGFPREFNIGLTTKDVRKDLNAKVGKISNRTDKSNLPQKYSGILSKESQQIPQTVSSDLGSPSSLGGGSSGSSIAQVPNSENPYFNTNKLNIAPEAKQTVNKIIQNVKPQIEKTVGKKLSNQEVINTAKDSAKVLNSVVDRAQTEDYTARLLKTRQQLAEQAQSGTVTKEYIDNLIAVKSHATDIARKLQSFSIGADPSVVTSREAILDSVLKVEKDSSKILKAAEGVDFNDLKQATDFYRQFVKPSAHEWVDLVRYNSMLSSPNTHMNNATSNLLNTAVVAPVEKTLTGALDFLGSKIKGKQQTQFASEGIHYSKGYLSSFHDAAHAFADSMRGKTLTGNLDVRQIPLNTSKGMAALNLPTRLLEASDQFFTALTKGGEESALRYRIGKGVKISDVNGQALSNSKYRLFRSQLHDPRQGTLLNSIDDFTGLIQKARNSSNPITSTIAKFTLPFVQTPMNIVKQGVEYSPIGFATLKGAPNKTEQLSKAILGSSAAAATAMLVASGRTTWAEPTNATKKAAYRAAGLQPYSVKIGDNWVSYAKLPPALGFPIAFISAIHDAEQNKTIDQNQVNVLLNASAKFGNFFADQSYVKNIGDLVSAAKGSPEAMTRFVSNYPQQLVPYRALMGWMARLTDPYQRKVNLNADYLTQQVQQLFTQIPGLSQSVPARVDKEGNPIPNQNKEINAFSPFRITTERPEQKQIYDQMQEKTKQTSIDTQMKNKLKASGDISSASGEKFYIKQSNGDIKTIDFSFQPTPPQYTGDATVDKVLKSRFTSEITRKKNDIVDLLEAGKIDLKKAQDELAKLGQVGTKGGVSSGAKLKKPKKISIKIGKVSAPKATNIKFKLSKAPKLKISKNTVKVTKAKKPAEVKYKITNTKMRFSSKFGLTG